jgi:hypothetical protein
MLMFLNLTHYWSNLKMSNDAMRAFAVGEAVKLVGPKGEVKTVIAAAKELLAFISPTQPAAAQQAQPAAEPPKTAGKAATTPKPATTPKKAATKAAPEPEPQESEVEGGEDAIDYTSDAGKEQVGSLVSQLIAANRRPEAIKLLSDYDATSVSGVKPGEREAFCAEARELIAAGDITG